MILAKNILGLQAGFWLVTAQLAYGTEYHDSWPMMGILGLVNLVGWVWLEFKA